VAIVTKTKHTTKGINKMKKFILAVVAGLIACSNYNAQAGVVTIDGSETWNGYMNVFSLTGSGAKDAYLFGSGWGLGDLKSTVTGNTVKLEPNVNTYLNALSGNAADRAYWTDGVGGGNKWMEANTFVEKAPGVLSGSLTFTGNVDSYSLASNYILTAFIKGLNPGNGYADEIGQFAVINSGSSSFSVSADLTGKSNLIMQYGFMVSGINANPAQSGLGSAVVSAVPEPSVASLLGFGVLGLVATRLRRRS
jgi:hypothetical protein